MLHSKVDTYIHTYTQIHGDTQTHTHILIGRNRKRDRHTCITQVHSDTFIHRKTLDHTVTYNTPTNIFTHTHTYSHIQTDICSHVQIYRTPTCQCTQTYSTYLNTHKCTYATGMCPHKTHMNTHTHTPWVWCPGVLCLRVHKALG